MSTKNEFTNGIVLMENIQLKVKSLETLLYEIKQISHNYEFDSSICEDIYAYIRNILTDCQIIVNNNKYNLFLTKDHTIQHIHGMKCFTNFFASVTKFN